jgi:hypothetical protein
MEREEDEATRSQSAQLWSSLLAVRLRFLHRPIGRGPLLRAIQRVTDLTGDRLRGRQGR